MCPSHILVELEHAGLGSTLPGGEERNLCSYPTTGMVFGGLILRTHTVIMFLPRSSIRFVGNHNERHNI